MSEWVECKIWLDPELKAQAEKLLWDKHYATLDEAFNEFLKATVKAGDFPFPYTPPEPNAETIAAMKEAEALEKDPNAKSYTSVEELFRDLKADD